MRRLAEALAAALILTWTNPSTNADGTPCTDLAGVRALVTQAATGNTYEARLDLWYLEGPDTLFIAGPGESVNIEFTLPHASAPYDWWRITLFAYDFSENESDSSNTISVNASDY